jgi:hypothetical protein
MQKFRESLALNLKLCCSTLPHNSRFRDIGRCFRRSLPPLLSPVAPCGHVILTSLSVTFISIPFHKTPHPLLKEGTFPLTLKDDCQRQPRPPRYRVDKDLACAQRAFSQRSVLHPPEYWRQPLLLHSLCSIRLLHL